MAPLSSNSTEITDHEREEILERLSLAATSQVPNLEAVNEVVNSVLNSDGEFHAPRLVVKQI